MDLVEAFNHIDVNKEPALSVKTFAAVIDNHHTEFIITNFSNKIVFFITQFEKIGNLYLVETEQVQNDVLSNETVYSIKPLLGAGSIEVEAALRYLSEQLDIKKPLLVSLTVKDFNVQHLKKIIKCIKSYK